MSQRETRLVDYSFARPGAGTIKAHGYAGAMRYLSDPGNPKALSTEEAHELRRAGLFVGLVWETTAERARAGHAAGAADARTARAAAAALGYPSHAVIFAAVDFDASPNEVRAYFAGWVSELGHRRAGDYGGIKITNANLTDWHWQTAAWSGGQLSPRAHLYQRAGGCPIGGCDENVVCRPIPLWGGTVAPPGHQGAPAPAPAPAPTPAPAPAPRPAPAPHHGYHERNAIAETRTARRNARKAGHPAHARRLGKALRWLLG